MNVLKGLYTWTLVTLLILAGCLGTGVINDTEGQSSDDSSSSDNLDSDNFNDNETNDNDDNDNWNDNATNDNNDNDNWNDNTTNETIPSDDNIDWNETEYPEDYFFPYGTYAIGGVVEGDEIQQAVFHPVAQINTTFDESNLTNNGFEGIIVEIIELHVYGDESYGMRFSTSCDEGNMQFQYTVTAFPAHESYRSYLPGAAFDCIHTIEILDGWTEQQTLSWSLVYSITPIWSHDYY